MTDKTLTAKRTLLATSLSLIIASPAIYAEETTTTELAQVEVSADKEKKISAEEIEQKQASNLQEVFRDKTDFSVGGGSTPAAQKLYARGLEDTMMNVSIDGAQQTGYLFHHQGRVGVESDIIKSVEAKAGTGAATAGPGALAGAVNFETKDATDLLRKGEKAGASLKSTYYSNGEGMKNTGTVFGRLGEEGGILVSGTRLDTNNYKDGNGDTVQRSAVKQDDLFTKLSGNVNENNYLSLSHEIREDEGNRSLRAHMIATGWNPETEQKNKRETTTFNHKYTSGPYLNTKATVYHTDASMDITNAGATSGSGVETWGTDLRNTMNFEKVDLTYGTDYRHDRSYQTGNGQAEDEKVYVLGFYAQNDFRFAPDWMLTSGARFDHYSYDDELGQNYNSQGISPNIGLTWFATDEVSLFVRHSRALRGVGLKEVQTMGRTTNAADIDPEKAHTTEFGTEYENGSWHAKAQGFTQRIQNFIPNSSSGVRDNNGTVEVWGYSADAGYRAGNFDTNVGMSYARPTLNGVPLSDGNMSLGTASGRTWFASLDYRFPVERVSVGWAGRAVERLTEVPENGKEKPGYVVHDIHVSWKPFTSYDFDLKLAVNNIFDKQYRDQSSFGYASRYDTWVGEPDVGRNFRLTAAVRF